MGKPSSDKLLQFKSMFEDSNARCGKRQFLTYYFIAAHPGCTDDDMRDLSRFCHVNLRTNPEQVQVFTPTPSTVSTMMYHTGMDVRGSPVFSEHSIQAKQRQKDILVPRVEHPQCGARPSGKRNGKMGYANRRRDGKGR